jgi:hypothetical protein
MVLEALGALRLRRVWVVHRRLPVRRPEYLHQALRVFAGP